MAGSRLKRLGVIAGVAAGAVFATGIGLWARDSPPFRDAYCWGAWQQNSGPRLLGDGLPGMVSPNRAWLAVPQQCTGRPNDREASLVVDVAFGEHDFDMEGPHDGEDREALARTVVAAANGVIRELGCTGAYGVPRDLPPIPERVDVGADGFCGVKGLTLPAASREYLRSARIGGGADGPARTCEVGGTYPDTAVRMTTVVDPGLTEIFGEELRYGGTRFGTEDKDYGAAGPRRAVYRAQCQSGPVVFLAEQLESMDGGRNFLADVMPAYVAAEAERVGCGRLTIELPRA